MGEAKEEGKSDVDGVVGVRNDEISRRDEGMIAPECSVCQPTSSEVSKILPSLHPWTSTHDGVQGLTAYFMGIFRCTEPGKG